MAATLPPDYTFWASSLSSEASLFCTTLSSRPSSAAYNLVLETLEEAAPVLGLDAKTLCTAASFIKRIAVRKLSLADKALREALVSGIDDVGISEGSVTPTFVPSGLDSPMLHAQPGDAAAPLSLPHANVFGAGASRTQASQQWYDAAACIILACRVMGVSTVDFFRTSDPPDAAPSVISCERPADSADTSQTPLASLHEQAGHDNVLAEPSSPAHTVSRVGALPTQVAALLSHRLLLPPVAPAGPPVSLALSALRASIGGVFSGPPWPPAVASAPLCISHRDGAEVVGRGVPSPAATVSCSSEAPALAISVRRSPLPPQPVERSPGQRGCCSCCLGVTAATSSELSEGRRGVGGELTRGASSLARSVVSGLRLCLMRRGARRGRRERVFRVSVPSPSSFHCSCCSSCCSCCRPASGPRL